MIILLVISILFNIVMFVFVGYVVYKFKAAQNVMKNFGVDLTKIDFDFWNNYGVGEVKNVKKD